MALSALVCASCPEALEGSVSQACLNLGIRRVFNKFGEGATSLGDDAWAVLWEQKVVSVAVKTAQALGASRASVICVAGGRRADVEAARLPGTLRAIKSAMNCDGFRVRAEWLEPDDFFERYGGEGSPVADLQGNDGNVHRESRPVAEQRGPRRASAAGRSGVCRPSQNGTRPARTRGPAVRCRACGEGFEDRWTMVNTHWFCGGREPSWICTECGSRLRTEQDCHYHQNSTGHLGIDRVNADEDGGAPTREAAEAEAPMTCQECGESFKDRWVLVNTHWFCRGREPSWLCAECGTRFDKVEDCVLHQAGSGHAGVHRVDRDEAVP